MYPKHTMTHDPACGLARACLLACLTLGGAALADSPLPAAPTSAPTTTAPDIQATPEAIALLDKIQAEAPKIKSIQADIRYDRIVPVVGDKQRRFGTMLYFPGPPAQFSIHFDRLLVDGRTDKQDRWYIFDGQWLVERLDDKKQFFKRQIVSPKVAQNSPDQADPLGSGNGPFIVPLSLKKDRVLARFVVSILPNKKGDRENTTQLLLKPKPGANSEYTEIHIWVANDLPARDESLIPLRVYTVGDSGNESIIDLTAVKRNGALPVQPIDTSEPKAEDKYQVSVTPWAE
jgi:hypothetical protein